MSTKRLMERGYNQGAAIWIMEQIKQGRGTLDQWEFSAINLKRVAQLNGEHEGYTSAPVVPAGATTITTKVRPGGSFANYLAYGHVSADGTFHRHGYPKDILTPIYGESWGRRGGAQYEYEVSFDVPADFPFYVVKVFKKSAVQRAAVEIMYTPKGNRYG